MGKERSEMNFNNDTATDMQRDAYLTSKGASICEDDGVWYLQYKGGDLRLDAEDEAGALFEACNIV